MSSQVTTMGAFLQVMSRIACSVCPFFREACLLQKQRVLKRRIDVPIEASRFSMSRSVLRARALRQISPAVLLPPDRPWNSLRG